MKADQLQAVSQEPVFQAHLKKLAAESMLGSEMAVTAGSRLRLYKEMGISIEMPHRIDGVTYRLNGAVHGNAGLA